MRLNRKFWLNKNTNDVETPEYYSACKKILCELAQKYLQNSMDVIDLACADGFFTTILANYCNKIIGFEYSIPMLNKANSNNNNDKISFQYLDVESPGWFLPSSQAVFCMGLLTVIHSENIVNNIVKNIYKSLSAGSRRLLVTRESLSKAKTFRWFNKDKHYGIYRSYDEYQSIFKNNVFSHINEIINFETNHTINSFHVWNIS